MSDVAQNSIALEMNWIPNMNVARCVSPFSWNSLESWVVRCVCNCPMRALAALKYTQSGSSGFISLVWCCRCDLLPFAAGFNINMKQFYSYCAGFTGTFLVTFERLHYASVNNAVPQQVGICTSLRMGQKTGRNVNCESAIITRAISSLSKQQKWLHTLPLQELCTEVLRLVTIPHSNIVLRNPAKHCSCLPFFLIYSRIVTLLIMRWGLALLSLLHFLSYLHYFTTP